MSVILEIDDDGLIEATHASGEILWTAQLEGDNEHSLDYLERVRNYIEMGEKHYRMQEFFENLEDDEEMSMEEYDEMLLMELNLWREPGEEYDNWGDAL